MSGRRDSLIPLSHQHQHALALVLIIRQRYGLNARKERAWREEMALRVGNLYSEELSIHFEVEETLLFPQMERYLGEIPLVAELRHDHELLRTGVGGVEMVTLLTALDEFAMRLELHVRKEERNLFAEFERRMPETAALRLGRELEARLVKTAPGF